MPQCHFSEIASLSKNLAEKWHYYLRYSSRVVYKGQLPTLAKDDNLRIRTSHISNLLQQDPWILLQYTERV